MAEQVRVKLPDPCTIIIFGASGDLTKRKLIPALFRLAWQKLTPENLTIVGISRAEETDEQFRSSMFDAIKTFSHDESKTEDWKRFSQGLFYLALDAEQPESYKKLNDFLCKIEGERGTKGNRMFYLAVSPEHYSGIVKNLGKSNLACCVNKEAWTRIIIEKPYGHDLASAKELNSLLAEYCKEDQIYRIDHYLGKETVQNILVFRFANSIFEPIWSHQYIDHVQITAAESIGIENRGAYYDKAGALRDMVQNHMLQLVCTTAMEPPAAFNDRSVRDEKAKVMQAIRPIAPEDAWEYTVRGQYADGKVDDKPAVAYRKEKNVDPNSRIETFTALKLFIDNWRWAGVPFYLRTGKRLPMRLTEIAIQFKRTPHLAFARTPDDQVLPNALILGIQPDEGIEIKFEAKLPGPAIRLRQVDMDFEYEKSFAAAPIEEAYERLLLDALNGDATLFARADWIELAWAFITPILQGWEADKSTPVPLYPAGSWGPAESNQFMGQDNRRWRETRLAKRP